MNEKDYIILLDEIIDIKNTVFDIKEMLEKQSSRNESIKRETIEIVDKIVKHHFNVAKSRQLEILSEIQKIKDRLEIED